MHEHLAEASDLRVHAENHLAPFNPLLRDMGEVPGAEPAKPGPACPAYGLVGTVTAPGGGAGGSESCLVM
ncbi:hypothetical protein GCM10023259_033240 [Thermocatellispora tengchongensis]